MLFFLDENPLGLRNFYLIMNIFCSNFDVDLWIANTEMLTEDKSITHQKWIITQQFTITRNSLRTVLLCSFYDESFSRLYKIQWLTLGSVGKNVPNSTSGRKYQCLLVQASVNEGRRRRKT